MILANSGWFWLDPTNAPVKTTDGLVGITVEAGVKAKLVRDGQFRKGGVTPDTLVDYGVPIDRIIKQGIDPESFDRYKEQAWVYTKK